MASCVFIAQKVSSRGGQHVHYRGPCPPLWSNSTTSQWYEFQNKTVHAELISRIQKRQPRWWNGSSLQTYPDYFFSLLGEYESLNRTPQILKLYFRVCRWSESGWGDRDELFPTYLRRLSAVSVSSNPLERKARNRRRGGAETRRTHSLRVWAAAMRAALPPSASQTSWRQRYALPAKNFKIRRGIVLQEVVLDSCREWRWGLCGFASSPK